MKRINDRLDEPVLVSEGEYDELYVNEIYFDDEQDGEVTGEMGIIQQFFGDITNPDGSDGESWFQPFTLYTDRIDATLNSRYEGERFIDLKQDPYLYVRFPDTVYFSKEARVELDKFIIESYYGDKVGYDEKRGLIYPTHVNDSKQLKNNNMKRIKDELLGVGGQRTPKYLNDYVDDMTEFVESKGWLFDFTGSGGYWKFSFAKDENDDYTPHYINVLVENTGDDLYGFDFQDLINGLNEEKQADDFYSTRERNEFTRIANAIIRGAKEYLKNPVSDSRRVRDNWMVDVPMENFSAISGFVTRSRGRWNEKDTVEYGFGTYIEDDYEMFLGNLSFPLSSVNDIPDVIDGVINALNGYINNFDFDYWINDMKENLNPWIENITGKPYTDDELRAMVQEGYDYLLEKYDFWVNTIKPWQEQVRGMYVNDSRRTRSLGQRIKDSVKMKTIRKKITDAKQKFFDNDLKRMQAYRRVTDSEGKVKENVVFLIEDSDVLAVFPNTYGTANRDRDTMVCYSHNGQHGVCTYDYANTLKTADSKQYNDLKDELANYVGYNLTIVDSLPSETELKQNAREIRDAYTRYKRGLQIADERMLARGEEIQYKGKRGTVQYALFHGKEPVVIRWQNDEGSEEFEIPYNEVHNLKIHDSEDDDVNVEPVDNDSEIDENEVTDGCGKKKGKKKTADGVKRVKITKRQTKKSE